MAQTAKQVLLEQVHILECGLSEACASGAFKNLKYVTGLNNSIEVIRAYINTIPEIEKTLLSNGKE